MGIAEDILTGPEAMLAALAWQLDCGIDEVIADLPVDRYALAPSQPVVARPDPAPERPPVQPWPPVDDKPPPKIDIAEIAQRIADAATSLDGLRDALLGFEQCELKKGARNTVFSDGNPRARVMVIGEAPGRDEDLEGRPFVGRAGQLLDRMFAAIGLSRQSPDTEAALYITNVMPWRPPGNREPEPEEIAMMRPFLARHIALADPEVLVVVGNTPLLALTGNRGILRARGQWADAFGKPLLPMVHPAYLLRNPAAKREAWADLQALQLRLREGKKS